jgi:hypothetical protein
MTDLIRLRHLSAPNRVLFLVGLFLIPAAFWFPRDSPLHGGGGLLGALMLLVAGMGRVNWSISVLSITVAVTCVSGAFLFQRHQRLGFILSLLSATTMAVLIGIHLYGRYRSSRRS